MKGSGLVVFVWVQAAVTGVLRRPIGGVGSRRLVLETLYTDVEAFSVKHTLFKLRPA